MSENIVSMIREAPRVNLPAVKCLLCEPLNESTGMCYDKSTVNLEQCDHPEECRKYGQREVYKENA